MLLEDMNYPLLTWLYTLQVFFSVLDEAFGMPFFFVIIKEKIPKVSNWNEPTSNRDRSYDEIVLVCRLIYYNIPGFYTNAKNLYNVCQKEGYSFRLQDIAKWLGHQYDY